MADMFLWLSDIEGESLDNEDTDEIEIVDFTFGINSNAPNALTQQAEANKATVDNIVVSKNFDKASVTLARYCMLGKQISEGIITCRKNTGGDQKLDYLIIEFKRAQVLKIGWTPKEAQTAAPESVTLSFGEMTLLYTSQKQSGDRGKAIEFRYDIEAHKEV
jgi:type VI secretion system secreted protein Hcp